MLIPVCCTAEIPATLQDKFLGMTEEEYMDSLFVFVDNINQTYEESFVGETVSSSAQSPFIGKSIQECYALLNQLRQITESDIDVNSFLVMDETSKSQETVLLVQVEDGGNEFFSIRVEFIEAYSRFMLYTAGEADIEGDQKRAATEPDGVLRQTTRMLDYDEEVELYS